MCEASGTEVRRPGTPSRAQSDPREVLCAVDLEALCQFLIALAIFALMSVIERGGKSFRSIILTATGGVLFALAVLIRPVAELVIPLLPVAIVLGIPNASWSKRYILAGLVFSIPAVVVAGWTLRNARV